MKKKKKIWHLYYGTRGTAGSYVDCLQKTALKINLNSSAFVSAKYRFKTGRAYRFFFPITERTEKRNVFLTGLRYLELAFGYKIVFWAALISRPVINLNLIDDLRLTYVFFRLLKFAGVTVFVTCHDVLSHHLGFTGRRADMFSRADKLIVHSSYAYRVLSGIVGEKNRGKIFRIPFPSSPYEEILSAAEWAAAGKRMADITGGRDDFFLFIGIIRKSKGIETLAQAWQMSAAGMNHKLVVAGKWSARAVHLKEKIRKLGNCILIDRYLNDEEFIYLLKKAKYVVLPYKNYAHSAILYACARNRAAVITSDIELFTDILPGYALMFPRDNSESLAALIDRAANFEKKEIDGYRDTLVAVVKNLNTGLEEEMKKAYEEFL